MRTAARDYVVEWRKSDNEAKRDTTESYRITT